MKISMSNMTFKQKQSRTLIKGIKSISISLPNKFILNKDEIKRGFMPNFIHSLDAANIHILIKKLYDDNINIPIYTVHDCFSSTPNNMYYLNSLVKLAFSDIYFNENYLEKMHNSLIDQIKSFDHKDIIYINNEIILKHKNGNVLFPELPDTIK